MRNTGCVHRTCVSVAKGYKQMRKLKLKSGKSEFNRFKINDEIVEPCVCKYNLDWCRGCISNINPYFYNILDVRDTNITADRNLLKRFDERIYKLTDRTDEFPDVRFSNHFPEELRGRILRNIERCIGDYSRFDSEYINKYFKSGHGLLDGKRNGCQHCYAHYKNNSQQVNVVDPNFDAVKKTLEALPKSDRIIRLGKTSECLSIVHLDLFSTLLDICVETGTSIIAPTKMLYYDSDIAKRLRLTGSVIGYSVFCDDLEPGPSNWGFDTEYRLTCAQRYANNGVNIVLKITMDCTQSFEALDTIGMPIYRYVMFLESNPLIGKQLIPLRIHKKNVANVATGHTKTELKTGMRNLFGNSISKAHYEPYHAGAYIPMFMHKDFADFFDGHICGKVGHHFYCDSCGLRDAVWDVDMDKTPALPVEINKNPRRVKQIQDKNQTSAFLQDTRTAEERDYEDRMDND